MASGLPAQLPPSIILDGSMGKFSDPDLQNVFAHELNGIEPHHGGVFFSLNIGQEGETGPVIYGGVAERINENWSIKVFGKVETSDIHHPELGFQINGKW